ncbi:hypothetical protein [Rehaibacterium terrae]|jgi:hypothetical protein|uniref:Uncharacterized protein n=1 Tax=Rehaibacterium terrae TaxID=1341696 RepID=A0A7W7XYS9_9GAMM|nr:hypothetical protein [Rehaibacterium terrae]MBB5014918.1 hypothetical protein [Rehaibacterium terrae]
MADAGDGLSHDWSRRLSPRARPLESWRPPDTDTSPRLRWFVLASVALLHLVLVWMLRGEMSPREPGPRDPTRIELVLLDADAPIPELRPPDGEPPPVRRLQAVAPAREAPQSLAETVDEPLPPPARSFLFRPDGALELPENLVDALDKAAAEQVEYRIANLDRAGMFLRPPPIDYEPTVFEAYWVPHENLLEEWVRKGIKEVSIPIPGSGWRIVCKVSLLAPGAGCGIAPVVQASGRQDFGPYVPPPNRNR